MPDSRAPRLVRSKLPARRQGEPQSGQRPQDDPGGHQIETTTPTGHRYGSRPPTVATIRETPIRIDYVLSC
jgi:hypothetical protein